MSLVPLGFPRNTGEHPEVSEFRAVMAREVRDFARTYADDPEVDDATFVGRMSELGYDLVLQMCRISGELDGTIRLPESFALRRPKRSYPASGAVPLHRTASPA